MAANYAKTTPALIKPFIADAYTTYPIATQQFSLKDMPTLLSSLNIALLSKLL